MRLMTPAAAVAILATVFTCVVSAQSAKPSATKPNFGGTWVFDADATKASADAAKMNGLPLFADTFVAEQDAKAFTMKVDLGQMVVTAIYNLDGSTSKNMSPPSVPGGAPIEVTSRARWNGAKLVVTSSSSSPGANGPVEVKSTRTLWFDAKGRLVIERFGTPRNMVPTSRSVYKKKA